MYQVTSAIDVARNTGNHAIAVAKQKRELAVIASQKHQYLSRFSPDYIRGATEVMAGLITLGAVAFVARHGLHRYRTAADIPRRLIKRQIKLHGYVLRVTDGDGLRFYHQPWLRRLRSKQVGKIRKLSEETLSVRLAGVDAPETAHFGAAGQKFGKIAKDWLKRTAQDKHATLSIHSTDQYNRILGTVHVKHENPLFRMFGFRRKNLSVELARAGLAEVYRGPNAEYGGQRELLEKLEKVARSKRIGMWSDPNEQTPTIYKAMLRDMKQNGGMNSAAAVIMPQRILSTIRKLMNVLPDMAGLEKRQVKSSKSRSNDRRRSKK